MKWSEALTRQAARNKALTGKTGGSGRARGDGAAAAASAVGGASKKMKPKTAKAKKPQQTVEYAIDAVVAQNVYDGFGPLCVPRDGQAQVLVDRLKQYASEGLAELDKYDRTPTTITLDTGATVQVVRMNADAFELYSGLVTGWYLTENALKFIPVQASAIRDVANWKFVSTDGKWMSA
jgi:hypothetical protein